MSKAVIQPKEEEKLDNFTLSAGIGYRDTTWKHIEDAGNTNTTYTITKAKYTIVEGDIGIPKISAKIGFNAHKESSGLSKANQFAAYLGIKGMSIRSEQGKFAGQAHFAGAITSEQTADVSFEQVYRFTELDYTFVSRGVAFLFGVRKTKWILPTEIALLGPGDSSGPTVFDPDFEANITSLIFGMDYSRRDFLNANKWTPGWGVMFSFHMGVGLGSSKIGDKAVRAAKSIYGTKMTDSSPGVFTIHSNGQLGPKYNFAFFGLKGMLGIGYDWNLLMLLGTARPARFSNEVQPVPYPNFVYHGPIVRSHITF